MQAAYVCSIDPKETSDHNSYGFRLFRGAREAVAKLRNLRPYSPEWLLDADIQKCFHRINHNWLLQNVPIEDNAVLDSWLKSGLACNTAMQETTMGVPRDRRCAHSEREPAIKNATLNIVARSQRSKVYVVRYANDFVATAANEIIRGKVEQIVTEFLKPRGLQLHPQKTRKVQLNPKAKTSFEFLDFEFSKHVLNPSINKLSAKKQSQTKLAIRPSKTNTAVK